MTLLTYFYDTRHVAPKRLFTRAMVTTKNGCCCARIKRDLPNGLFVLKQMRAFLAVYGVNSNILIEDDHFVFQTRSEEFCSFIWKRPKLVLTILERIESMRITEVPKFTSFSARRQWLLADFGVDSIENPVKGEIAVISNDPDHIFVGHYQFTKDAKHEGRFIRGNRIFDPLLI